MIKRIKFYIEDSFSHLRMIRCFIKALTLVMQQRDDLLVEIEFLKKSNERLKKKNRELTNKLENKGSISITDRYC